VFLLFHDVYAADPAESGFRSAAADRYKLTVAQFERHLSALDAAGAGALPFGLTFDDGGVSFHAHIADALERRGWRGHCFVPTDCIGRDGFMTRTHIRDLAARGHVIGSHSASHPPRISACPRERIAREWTRSRQELEDLLGAPVTSASVPGGFFSRRVAETAANAGFRVLFTSEPVAEVARLRDCLIAGRFAIRQTSKPDLCARLVNPPSWSRFAAWAGWTAKGLVKPILGPAYSRAADWLMAQPAVQPPLTTSQEK
jgi:peptidoglycan/xylan/chitin deacetylase (PgdA/CDA1 family)